MNGWVSDMRLENWSIVTIGSPYIPPEHRAKCLQGEVYSNPDFNDGDRVITSPISSASEDFVKTVSGSIYMLGVVSSDYESEYPNARQRLLSRSK